ncbi:MAG TPA: cytochrome c [Candidatus Bathyarchaeia archaeon]|nr:cytochrome c [Candidatus Bathyarchaeia archaeon]
MTSSSRILLVACAGAFLFVSGCQIRQDMADQPKYKPLAPTDFFADGRSERPIIENTVARGSLDDDALYVSKESNVFPLELNAELMQRGKDRYGVFCTPCHGIQGDGNGMVAMRGMKHPPTYHEERLRKVPNGYLFDVITNGFGGMLGYSAQIAPRDRWAIIAYIRALQLSRNAPASELPSDLRDKLNNPTSGGAAK